VRGARWRRTEPLLLTNLREHAVLPDLGATLPAFAQIEVPVLLLGGARSPRFATDPLRALHDVLPRSTVELLPGLGHLAPDGDGAPGRIAERLVDFLAQP
jgi:pimeloyl-ACP methyl ester carboxylesterase